MTRVKEKMKHDFLRQEKNFFDTRNRAYFSKATSDTSPSCYVAH